MTGAVVKQQQHNRNDGPGGKGQGGPKDKAGAGQHHKARQKAATLSVGQLADLPATASKHQVRAAPCARAGLLQRPGDWPPRRQSQCPGIPADARPEAGDCPSRPWPTQMTARVKEKAHSSAGLKNPCPCGEVWGKGTAGLQPAGRFQPRL